jgi:hypothetical protein
MRRKKQKQQIPWLEPTPLAGMDAVDELKALDDDALKIELHNATETERYLRTMNVLFRQTDDVKHKADAELMEHGAAYSRIAREVMVLILFLRDQEKQNGDKKKGGGYL